MKGTIKKGSGKTSMARLCVLFDLDGTLVDSEPLCNQAFLDLLPGLKDSVAELASRYRGKKLAAILRDLETRLGSQLPLEFEAQYRRHVSQLISQGLRPMPGVRDMLEATNYPRCIASSGPLEKIRQLLEASELTAYFGDCLFSSYQIGCWKPDPGLFLHAAQQMGFQPRDCVVVEDSEVGISAAIAAGMRALRFISDVEASEPSDNRSFNRMADLPAILHELSGCSPG